MSEYKSVYRRNHQYILSNDQQHIYQLNDWNKTKTKIINQYITLNNQDYRVEFVLDVFPANIIDYNLSIYNSSRILLAIICMISNYIFNSILHC